MSDSELLVDPYDIEKMVSISLRLLNDPNYNLIQRKNAIEYVKNYTWDEIAKKILSYYQTL